MNKSKNKHSIFRAFLLHIHPKQVDERTIKFTRTFGLGGVNALLFVILALTGLLLRFAYIPTQMDAYDSILSLQNNLIFGKLLRNIHHWLAMIMLITAFLHLLRVFYSQSIYRKRRRNWFLGLGLMFCVLFSNFTGYLLPWDQLSYWAVTIMTNILEYIPLAGNSLANLFRGGEMVNEDTLLNFYTLHTGLLPLLFVVFMVLHFWQVRKAGGVTVTNNKAKSFVPAYPNLVLKEIVVALSIIALLILISIFFDAPLLDKANPAISPNPSKAPWYFMGFQEMLMHIHPVFAATVIPVLLLFFFFYLPYFKCPQSNIGIWFYSKKGKTLILISFVFSFILTLGLIFLSDYFSGFQNWFTGVSSIISTGFLPFCMYLIPLLSFLFFIRIRKRADINEVVISLFTIVITSYLVMMIIGICLRGKNMELILF